VLQSGSNADLRALVSPLSLAAGTYWLAFHNGPLTTTFRAEWYWAAADDPLRHRHRGDSQKRDLEEAMTLPESIRVDTEADGLPAVLAGHIRVTVRLRRAND
jgi:hypothetical protein